MIKRSMLRASSIISIVIALLFLSGCSTTPREQNAEEQVEESNGDPRDPFESINRKFWTFNWDYADKYVLKPASETYVEYTPKELRSGLENVALNFNEPSSAINSLLQGKFSKAGKTTGRFLLNSTIGLLGFFDPASDFGWHRNQEEFGEVLGFYGVSDGPYLMIPALGPSSVREEVGDFVDRYYWPLAIIDFWPNLVRNGVLALEARAKLSDQANLINQSIDPYEFVKNAYFQNVAFKVYDGNPPIEEDPQDEELDSYFDELDEIDETE